jgi:hypothetical protein
VYLTITSELAIAVGEIGAKHPDCAIRIEWRESGPKEVWHVDAIDGQNPARYVVEDETARPCRSSPPSSDPAGHVLPLA